MKVALSNIVNTVQRWGVWAVLGLLSILILLKTFSLFSTLINLIVVVILIELLALALSGLALYIYTAVNFTKALLDYDKNGKYNSIETHAFARVVASVFIGVHILVGAIIIATYQSTVLNILQGQ